MEFKVDPVEMVSLSVVVGLMLDEVLDVEDSFGVDSVVVSEDPDSEVFPVVEEFEATVEVELSSSALTVAKELAMRRNPRKRNFFFISKSNRE